MSQLNLEYSYEHVPTVKRFAKSKKRWRGLMGPFGSGKSSGCVMELVRMGHMQKPSPIDGIRRTKFAVIRNTYRQLKDTTERTVINWLPPMMFGDWKEGKATYIINKFEGVEIELIFRALDRPEQISNLLSLELTGAWINEAREVPWAILDALDGRINRYPGMQHGGTTFPSIILDTNPPDDDSEWYDFFEVLKPSNAAIFKQPSGLGDKAENLPALDGWDDGEPGRYYTDLEQGKSKMYTRVYLEGKYGSLHDGQPIYSEYNDEIHLAPADYKPNPSLPVIIGWDYGLTPAAIFMQITPRGVLHVFDEMYTKRMGIKTFTEEVDQFLVLNYPDCDIFEEYGDPAGNDGAETDLRTCRDIQRELGHNVKDGAQDLFSRIESVKWFLNRNVDGLAGFQLSPRCIMLRKGFNGGYRFRRRQVSYDVRYEEKPDKNKYSHTHDALQYPCTRISGRAKKDQRERERSTRRENRVLRSIPGRQAWRV